MGHVPVVFISSTSEDLKEHRAQAAQAARDQGLFPEMMEEFAASGHRTTLPACLEKVDRAEVVVVLVAHRYGWVPEDPSNPEAKSITWLECDHARAKGKEVLAFLVDPKFGDWPVEKREDYRLVTERNQPGIKDEVERNEARLVDFKEKLGGYLRSQFTDAATVRPLVSKALAEWLRRHPTVEVVSPDDAEGYLKVLEDDTRQIRIKHLKTRRAEPYFFGIDSIYIPLTTVAGHETARGGAMGEMGRELRVALERELSYSKMAIVGPAGSGKSTFLRRLAFELCRNLRGTRPADAPAFLPPDYWPFPILIRIADFAVVLETETKGGGLGLESEEWIPRYLGRRHGHEAFFRAKLKQVNCLLMLDGLDEAPNTRMRTRIARLIENAAKTYPCRYLVSTRPRSYEGDTVLEGFHQTRIGDLERPEIRVFLDHFAQALELNLAESAAFREDLERAFDSRPEIDEMGRNPLMLTALAILQHGGGKLPEYRYELFDSILGWLARAREGKELPDKECLRYLRRLALAMQDAPDGRIRQINRRDAAELWAREFGGTVEQNGELLERETHDSAIISPVGKDLEFWHLSLQEYLAAKEIAGLPDQEQIALVVKSGKLYDPEWRDMMRLLGGVLCGEQSERKIDGLFRAILEELWKNNPGLKEQVRCAALLSAMMRDLSRMGYEPKTPDYERTVQAMRRLFEPGESEKIEIAERIEAADLLGQVGDPRFAEDPRQDEVNWIEIPPGDFSMGAQKLSAKDKNYDPEAWDDESRLHDVKLRGFRIRRYAVTVQEFGVFMKKGGYKTPKYWVGAFGEFQAPEDWDRQKQYPNRPVVGVSWFEAAAYCAWMGACLPSEAQWERAARGPEGWRYPWGNDPALDPSRANYKAGQPMPVGLCPKGNTREGLCDMLGNVWEWCEDWYGEYQPASQENPVGPKSGEDRVLRGGSWYNYPLLIRVSVRNRCRPRNRNEYTGFRCAGELG
jgi:formylglycine-generating enzyme required for sulfatase activity